MQRDQAKDYILNHSKDYFKPDKSKRGFICPVCNSGNGKNGTGITSKDGIHYTCWKGCFTNADIFEIIGKERGLTEFIDQFNEACRYFNIKLEGYNKADERAQRLKEKAIPQPPQQVERPQRITEFTDFFLEAHQHINEIDYIKNRGISEDLINHFKLGYVENWKHPKADNSPATPRLIIPITKYSYLARDIRENIPAEQEQYKKSKVKGKEHPSWIFNYTAIKKSTQPIFILEGEIDALSIMEVGGQAVAIGSTAYTRQFIEYCKYSNPTQPLILALDNDEAGEKAQGIIKKDLQEQGFIILEANIAGEHKDANDALINNRKALKTAVEEAKYKALEELKKIKKEQIEKIYKESALGIIENFQARQADGIEPLIISTGFEKLDTILNGGLRAGLYTIGAVSSLGKTSLAVQIADNIAKLNIPVLYVSLEMAKEEIIAKIISRITYEISKEKYNSFNFAKTTIGILDTHKYKKLEDNHRKIIDEAIQELGSRANNLFILEGMGNIGAQQIKEKALELKNILGKAPIIFVDYLQILAAEDNFKGTEKMAIDKAVVELKRISRDLNTPIICISSFSRNNYDTAVGLSSFKESGAIEYTSDVLIGLQLKGLEDITLKEGDERKDKLKRLKENARINANAGRAKELELKLLKNRNGNIGELYIDFYPMFNYFKEGDGEVERLINDIDDKPTI